MTNRRVVEAFWTALQQGDIDAYDSIMHPDVVVTYPQSGEVIRGRDNLMAVLRNFPIAFPTAEADIILDTTEKTVSRPSLIPFGMSSITIVDDGELVVGQAVVTYPEDVVYNTCSIFKVRSQMIVEETTYFAAPFEAPEWRREWVEGT